MTAVEGIFLIALKEKKKDIPQKKYWSLSVISILILRHMKLFIIKKYSVGLQEKATSVYRELTMFQEFY